MGCANSTSRDSPHESPRPASPRPRNNEATVYRSAPSDPSPRSLAGSSAIPSTASKPNQALRPPDPLPSSPNHLPNLPAPWSRSQLDREREAFFDTRVSGHPEVWKALRAVCEMLRMGNIAEAQGILDAANITCPTGKLAGGRSKSTNREKGGVYDERGQRYELPTWVVMDPEDLLETDEKDLTDAASVDDPLAFDDAGSPRKEEKGKGRAEDPGEMVELRARLSDRGTDVTISVGTREKVAVAVRRIQAESGCQRIRLMYLGKAMDERVRVEQTNWRVGQVVNALVFQGDEGMIGK